MSRNADNRVDFLKIFNSFLKDNHFTSIGKLLGRGSFGEVREIVVKNKIMAGKVVPLNNNCQSGDDMGIDLKGQNIVKINKIVKKNVNGIDCLLIIMEKAKMKDLGKLNDYFHNNNLIKLIYNPFNEVVGDNLLRFYSKQIINALENINRSNYVHFNLNPQNLLIDSNLIIKLSDFSLLKKINDKEKGIIPGGTNGYLSLDYYKNNVLISGEEARKQDYFSLGATLFFLKYGKQLINYKKWDNKDSSIISIINELEKDKVMINTGVFTDKNFIVFIKDLVSYETKDRPNFEQIYRNKWLNKNLEKLDQVLWGFDGDETNLLIEFQKNDYLIEKEKLINKNPCRFHFKKKKSSN